MSASSGPTRSPASGTGNQRLDLEPHALVFSYEHQLLVEGA